MYSADAINFIDEKVDFAHNYGCDQCHIVVNEINDYFRVLKESGVPGEYD